LHRCEAQSNPVVRSFSIYSTVTTQRPRLFLIDGSSYIFRAFFGTPPLDHSTGLPTHAVFGFLNLLLNLLKQYQPEYATVVLDAGRETFRHQLFSAYKCNRPERPAALTAQIPYLRRLLESLNLPLLELPGYEADDLIATLCETMVRQDCDLVIVSSDKDFMQLVSRRIQLFDSARNRWFDTVDVHTRFGVSPDRVTQVMGLMGDPVDNIPGVRGVGAKTAIALIQQFDTLENLYYRLDEVPILSLRGALRLRQVLEDGRESAFLSRDLATVRRDAPLAVNLEDLRRTGFHMEKLRGLFAELEFTNLVTLLDHGRL
jgi:DNA polymerase-1